QVPPERLMRLRFGDEEQKIRILKEDDLVQEGQILAQLDNQIARNDWASKNGKINAAKQELASAEKVRDEARNRYETELGLSNEPAGVTTRQEVRLAKLTWERAVIDVQTKTEEVKLAELERKQAQTILDMHLIRATIPGVIKVIHKHPGEAVKNYEPILEIHNLLRLQAEGQVDVQNLSRLTTGMRVQLQVSQVKGPAHTLIGHFQEITGLAVSKDPVNPVIVSGSEDGTVRVWDGTTWRESRVLQHPSPVRAVVCTPPTAQA